MKWLCKLFGHRWKVIQSIWPFEYEWCYRCSWCHEYTKTTPGFYGVD